MGGGEGTKWRQLLDEKQARGPQDVAVDAVFIAAEEPVDARDVPIDDVVDLLADEGILLGGRPGGGGGGIEGLAHDPTTVATITIVFSVTQIVVAKLFDGILSAIGAEAFGAAKRAVKRLRRHPARQLAEAKTALSIEAVGAGFVSINLPTSMSDRAWESLQNVSIPPFPLDERITSYEIDWDAGRQRWVLLLPDDPH
jgi:hypothetical protein